jgi:hypothetical protein
MNELQAEIERLRTLVLLLYPYVRSAPVGLLDLLEKEMNGGPRWQDQVGAVYARRNVN